MNVTSKSRGKTLKMSTVGSKMPPSVDRPSPPGIPWGGSHWISGHEHGQNLARRREYGKGFLEKVADPTEGGIFDPTVLIFEVFLVFLRFRQVFPGFTMFFLIEKSMFI